MPRKPKSKSTRMRERERRCDSLYWHRGYKPPEICDILCDEGLFDERSSPAANLRWVQDRVKMLRAGAEPDAILRLQRPAETERYRQQLLRAQREVLDIIESDDTVQREAVTPKGDVVTVEEPKWSSAEKNKALKTFVAVAEKLALVNSVAVKGADLGETERPADDKPARTFAFKVSGRDLDSLIGERIGKGVVN